MELYLIYIHEIGFDHEGKYFYEFIFSDSIDNIGDETWGEYPASGNPTPPSSDDIKQVGKIELDNHLLLAQDNEQFAMWDAIDGVIPLAWENIDGLEEYPTNRLVFPFGMLSDEVTDKLYERDIRITFKNEIKEK